MAARASSTDLNRLEQGQAQAPSRGRDFPWLTTAGFAFLTFNSGMAVYRSQGDMEAISFVVFSYLDLVCLFYCLRLYDQDGGPNPFRIRIVKAAVWSLTTLLTVMFGYRVAAVMPMAVAVLVWAMAAVTFVGGFYAFFTQDHA